VEHWNPVSMQLSDDLRWTGRGYELTSPCISGWKQIWNSVDASTGAATVCWHYIHSLADLIGGLCDTGFHILNYAERGQGEHSAAAGSGATRRGLCSPRFYTICPESRAFGNTTLDEGRLMLTPKMCYFVCTLPPSGSWLLSESLEQTRIAGRPRESFEPRLFEKEPEAGYPEALARSFVLAPQRTAFGAKLHWYQFEYMSRIIAPHCHANISVPCLMAEQFVNLRY